MVSDCRELYSTLARHEDMFDKVLEAKGRQAIARGSRMTGVSYIVLFAFFVCVLCNSSSSNRLQVYS